MHLKGCGFSSRAEFAQFSVQLREVWLYLMDWDLLGPKVAQLSPSYKPVYMHGAVCATQRHMLLLFKWTLLKNLLVFILCHFASVSKMTQGTQT